MSILDFNLSRMQDVYLHYHFAIISYKRHYYCLSHFKIDIDNKILFFSLFCLLGWIQEEVHHKVKIQNCDIKPQIQRFNSELKFSQCFPEALPPALASFLLKYS